MEMVERGKDKEETGRRERKRKKRMDKVTEEGEIKKENGEGRKRAGRQGEEGKK